MLQLITPEYQKLNEDFHVECSTYGAGANKWAENIVNIIKTANVRTVLDYGCGKGVLRPLVKEIVQSYINYDICVPEFSERPKGVFDLVLCLDVMEHVEPMFTDNVLCDIFDYTGKLALFNIATKPSVKNLPDGRNTHINLRSEREWLVMLQKYFNFINVNLVNGTSYSAINYFGSTIKVSSGV